MKTFYVFLFLLIWQIPSTIFAQPKLSIIDGPRFQLGEVQEGDTVHKTITLRNDGKDTLHIEYVRTSCGCTLAKPTKEILPPKDTTSLMVSFKSEGFGGKVRKEIFITSNDPNHPDTSVNIYISVLSLIAVSPSYVNFGQTKLYHPVSRTVSLTNTTSKSITITSATSPDTQVTVTLSKKSLRPHAKIDLNVVYNPTSAGKILGQLELKTTHPQKPLLKISYTGLAD